MFPQVFGVLGNPWACFPLHLQDSALSRCPVLSVCPRICSVLCYLVQTPQKCLARSWAAWSSRQPYPAKSSMYFMFKQENSLSSPCTSWLGKGAELNLDFELNHGWGKEQSQSSSCSSCSSLPCAFQVTLDLELLQGCACVPWRQGVLSAGSLT